MLVLTTFILLTWNGDKKVIFKKMFHIYYLIQVHHNKIQVLFNIGNEVNVMIPNYAQNLSFIICKTNIGAE